MSHKKRLKGQSFFGFSIARSIILVLINKKSVNEPTIPTTAKTPRKPNMAKLRKGSRKRITN